MDTGGDEEEEQRQKRLKVQEEAGKKPEGAGEKSEEARQQQGAEEGQDKGGEEKHDQQEEEVQAPEEVNLGGPEMAEEAKTSAEEDEEEDNEEEAHLGENWEWSWDHSFLPAFEPPIFKDTCWAQAPILCVEAHYKIKHTHDNPSSTPQSFPRLSIRNCIDETRALNEPHGDPSINQVFVWLQYCGVTTMDDYEYVEDEEAWKRYTIKGSQRIEKNKDRYKRLTSHLRTTGPFIGGFAYREDYNPVHYHCQEKVSEDPLGNPIDHLVMVIGYGKKDGKRFWRYYNGFGDAPGIMDYTCLEEAYIISC